MAKNLKNLGQQVWKFREARDWAQFHHPKELASALSIEVSEIMELFRFRSAKEVTQLLLEEEYAAKVGDECADSLFLLLLLAHECGIDLEKAFERKMKLLETRYPVEKARGSNAKWTTYAKPNENQNLKASES